MRPSGWRRPFFPSPCGRTRRRSRCRAPSSRCAERWSPRMRETVRASSEAGTAGHVGGGSLRHARMAAHGREIDPVGCQIRYPQARPEDQCRHVLFAYPHDPQRRARSHRGKPKDDVGATHRRAHPAPFVSAPAMAAGQRRKDRTGCVSQGALGHRRQIGPPGPVKKPRNEFSGDLGPVVN